jgi:hypothetical protein
VLTTAALAQPAPSVPEQPDAHRTKAQLVSLLGRYPSNLEIVLANDPSLLTNQTYLSTYPALAGFAQPLAAHQHWHIDVSYLNIGGTFY